MDELTHEIQEWTAGIIDFKGQEKSKFAVDAIVSLGSVLSIVAGFVLQNFDVTVYAMSGTIVAALIACLPFPAYRKHELVWLTPPNQTTSVEVIVEK